MNAVTPANQPVCSPVNAAAHGTVARLWVDDLRPAPLDWAWAKTSSDAIAMLTAQSWTVMSLDHDLGGDDTARVVVLWLCEQAHDRWPSDIRLHTANPVGESWLRGMVKRYAPDSTVLRHRGYPTDR